MKQKTNRRRLRRALSGVLTGAMLLSQLSLGTAFAAEDTGPQQVGDYDSVISNPSDGMGYGGDSAILFDTGYGPTVNSANTPSTHYPDPNGTNPKSIDLSGPRISGKGYLITGHAGDLLSQTGSVLEHVTKDKDNNAPALPWGAKINGGTEGTVPHWDGMKFTGWTRMGKTVNLNDGNVQTFHIPSFPYQKLEVYRAVWTGDNADKKELKVVHYYDGRAAGTAYGDSNFDDLANAALTIPDGVHRFNWTTEQKVSLDAVSKLAMSPPGYKLDTVYLKGKEFKAADGTTVGTKGLSAGSDKVTGTMPNQNAAIGFRYTIDPAQKFTVTVKYVLDDGSSMTDKDGNTIADDSSQNQLHPDEEVTVPLANESNFLEDASHNKQYIFEHVEISGAQREDGTSGVFPGKFTSTTTPVKWQMGNQDVKFNCVYKQNPAFTSNVTIQYVVKNADGTFSPVPDTAGTGTLATEMKNLTPNTETELTLPQAKAGYTTGGTSDYQADLSNFNNVAFSSTTPPYKLKVNPKVQGGTIKVIYHPDYNDPTAFTRVNIHASGVGQIGASLTGYIPNNTSMTMRELLSRVSGMPESNIEDLVTFAAADQPYYEVSGWYPSSASGVKNVGSAAIALSDTLPGATFNGNSLDYVAEVGKKAGKWIDVSFQLGSGTGNITPQAGKRLNYSGANQLKAFDANGEQTKFSDYVPLVNAGTGYSALASFGAGWYVGNTRVAHYDDVGGTPTLVVDASDELSVSQTFTFNFAPILPPDSQNHIPSATAAVDSSTGTGTITVQAPNNQRAYVVVDEDGNVVGNQDGTSLVSGKFTGLTPGRPYHVYEVPLADLHNYDTHNVPYVPPAVNPGNPCDVVIPAIDRNYSLNDGANGTRTLVVNPTAPNTEYALVDENGQVVPVNGSADGFINPNGGSATFENLDPTTNYTVVARPVGTTHPAASRVPYGKNINTGANSGGSGSSSTAEYDLYIEGPDGKATSYRRNGVATTITSLNYQHIKLQAGDEVTIGAASTGSNGGTFDHWNIVLGNPSNFINARTATFVMPAETVRVSPIYKRAQQIPGYPATASTIPLDSFEVDYGPKNGDFGISGKDLNALEAVQTEGGLFTPADVDDVIANLCKIHYNILLEKKAGPNSSQKSLVEGAMSSTDNVEYAWAMKVKLRRTRIPGSSRDVTMEPEYKDHAVGTVYAALPTSLSTNGASDLALYEIDPDSLAATDISGNTGVDLNQANGEVSFPGRVGRSYVLAYKRSYKVTIANASGDSADAPGLPQTINDVARGEALSSSNAFNTLLAASIPEKLDNERYIRKGFSKSATNYQAYDLSSPLNGEKTLYVWYEENPDWNKAHTDLKGGIDTAQDLLNGGKLTADQQAQLQDAINDALAVFNKNNPSATIAEQEAALARLKALIDSFTGGGVTPGPNPNPPSPNPHNGGGGSGGGGGGGGSYSGGSRIPVNTTLDNNAYRVGIDGDWINIDPANHKWEFQLKNKTLLRGTWANLSYTFDGKTVVYRYHFADDAIMDSGWFKDVDGSWYFLCTTHDGWFGRAIMGWHHDESDGRWYYLNTVTGAMQINWQFVNGRWYFLNPDTPRTTWSYDHNLQKWVYNNPENARPYGSLYMGERTPDNHDVDRDGAWIQMRP